MTDDQDYLSSLVKHPGWLLFKEQARKTWGPEGYGKQLKLAVMQAKANSTDISAAVAAVDKAADELNALLSWPAERLKQLAAHPDALDVYADLHRGGR